MNKLTDRSLETCFQQVLLKIKKWSVLFKKNILFYSDSGSWSVEMSSWHKETNAHSDFILSVQSEDLGTIINS